MESLTKKYYGKLLSCPNCGHIYRKGRYFEHIMQLIGQLIVKPAQTVRYKEASRDFQGSDETDRPGMGMA